MHALSTILSLLTAIAGWYYLFYSRAALQLSSIEDQKLNTRRGMLRRFGGAAMLLLAVLFFAGFHTVDADANPTAFALVWLGVTLLLAAIVVLALIDLRLTARLRSRPGSDH